MKVRFGKILLIPLVVAAIASPAWGSDPYKVSVRPSFEGELPSRAILPLDVTIQNGGADARGLLRVSSQGGGVTYPIELPRGANKRITVFPFVQYNDIQFRLETDQGNQNFSFMVPGVTSEGLHVMMIGDVPGELSFIKSTKSQVSNVEGPENPNNQMGATLLDTYVRPENAPARPLGYTGIYTIVLGSGSERLTNEQVDAIKLWVANGRSIVFLGGASAPILTDPRWIPLLPASGFHLAQMASSQSLSELANSRAPAMTIMTGTPLEGTTSRKEGSLLLTADRTYGLGHVTYFSFNPFESPMDKWEGRKEVVVKLMRVGENVTASNFLATAATISPQSGIVGPGAGSTRYIPPTTGVTDDPFSTELPPAGRMFLILACYFVVVIPVNFLVLKKLKRGELAWITAPVISLGFAAILFTSAASLYSAKMSTATTGLIIGQEGSDEALFTGSTEMFVPRAGSYDLKLSNVDSLQGIKDQGYGAALAMTEVESVDDGEIRIPTLVADNLAFRKIDYRQRVPIGKWFHAQLTKTGPDTARCEIYDTGPYSLEEATLYVGKNEIKIGKMEPGDTKTIPVHFTNDSISDNNGPGDIRMFLLRRKRVALTGNLIGFRPGPQIGTEVKARSLTKLYLFSNLEVTRP